MTAGLLAVRETASQRLPMHVPLLEGQHVSPMIDFNVYSLQVDIAVQLARAYPRVRTEDFGAVVVDYPEVSAQVTTETDLGGGVWVVIDAMFAPEISGHLMPQVAATYATDPQRGVLVATDGLRYGRVAAAGTGRVYLSIVQRISGETRHVDTVVLDAVRGVLEEARQAMHLLRPILGDLT